MLMYLQGQQHWTFWACPNTYIIDSGASDSRLLRGALRTSWAVPRRMRGPRISYVSGVLLLQSQAR